MATNVSNYSFERLLNFKDFVTPWNERISCVLLFNCFNLAAILTNGCAVGLSLFTDLRKKKVNQLIANLAFSDFLLPLMWTGEYVYILYRESLPQIGCSMIAFFAFLAATQEFAFPPVLAVNRYVSLYKAESYDRIYTPLNTFLMTASTGLFSTCVCLLFLLTGHVGYDVANEHCCVVVDEDDVVWITIYWVAVVLPLVGITDSTLVYCNWKIYKKLKEHANSTGSLLKNNVVKENAEILYFLVIDMLLPICTHSVYHVARFVYPHRFALWGRQFFTCLFISNAALRGGIILSMLRPYRMAFKQYILRSKPNQITPM